MRIISILLPVCMLMALPLAAHADERCKYSAPRDSDLNLTGVKTVVFDIGPHTLDVNGGQDRSGSIHGKACASDAKRLGELVVNQAREGDKLIVRAERNGLLRKGSWSGNHYGYLTLTANLPDNIAVQVKLGSGDVVVDGVASLSADVGSGDLEAHHIRGTFYADVGSGDIKASDLSALHVISVGSGDLSARDLRGDARIDSINSGDLRIANANGHVAIGSIGSGDASLSDISGNVTVRSIGSGDLEAKGIHGDLIVDRIGSGSVDHRNVTGSIRLPKHD